MRVGSSNSPYYNPPTESGSNFFTVSNRNLKNIEARLHINPEPDREAKLKLNEETLGGINEVEEKLNNPDKPDSSTLKPLQILKIKYGMTAIACGDTDWESFNLSEEIYKNNESFMDSGDLLLTLDEQTQQQITKEARQHSWNCCQYNFAYNMTYYEILSPAEGKKGMPASYAVIYNTIKATRHVSDEIATAVSNAIFAKELCKNSFTKEEELVGDKLFNALVRLNDFYDKYLDYENPEADAHLREMAVNLMADGIFLPSEIKENLGINE